MGGGRGWGGGGGAGVKVYYLHPSAQNQTELVRALKCCILQIFVLKAENNTGTDRIADVHADLQLLQGFP